MKRTLNFIIIFAASIVPMFAQNTETNSPDVRLVKNLPHVYISFERVGKRKPLRTSESDKGVWLRFHNNSKWQVGFCQWDVAKEYGDKDLVYEIESYKNINSSANMPIARKSGGCPRVYIASGKSILFSVPHEHLADGLAIKVPFRYEWELNPDGFANGLEPKHYAYFYSGAIPKK